MAVESEVSSIEYAGNESTSTGYPIPFPYLDPSHIEVGTLDEDDAFVALGADEFTVNEDDDEVTTDPAIDSADTLVIRRTLPLTQPTVYNSSSPFLPETHEQALDRLAMQIQQLARAIDGGTATTSSQLVSPAFADASARAAATPSRVGHLGIQLDNNTLWRGTSLTAGAWSQVGGVFTFERLALTGDLSAQTIWLGHLPRAGTLTGIRFCLDAYQIVKKATVNVLKNGANVLSSDLELTAETVLATSGFASTAFAAGDRIDVEIVSLSGGGGDDPPTGLQVILIFSEL
jgi:hypothetical protein